MERRGVNWEGGEERGGGGRGRRGWREGEKGVEGGR